MGAGCTTQAVRYAFAGLPGVHENSLRRLVVLRQPVITSQ
jgi:hypothetical protein